MSTAVIFDEQSTGVIPCSFRDRDGSPVVPNWVRWTLTRNGSVINEREQVDVTPGADIEIVLSGMDLQLLTTENKKKVVKRKITVEASYDSDLGDDLSLKGDYEFQIRNLDYIK
ncbi:hypothetical protein PITCH_A2000013 [uncultured Desulfobacterium sp.]|uniref:Uncharacterized protein n=1 Tax=uncultured Desulfobacterium sp. TaxID=201089 RepID=A0A445MWC7_9BACT|nr:hypothetical protein PITCH_A2000013 [uncultured Desulfobacterium sp.]